MLELKNIVKDYVIGNNSTRALNDVSIKFRESEFVSILGPSGCGKTTLLNIIGGLDQYTTGDLIINGISTKKFKDADWDNYRNHSIGFVFQNYNLIPHQDVLSNVELALTLSGISKKERKERAIEALKQVGLIKQIHKKPNQMSGGQMQRVAIARALVNNPDIILADEPTGALDTQTSIQIMDILKNISKDKLIIMVTHNPDLAEQYSSRIIRAIDGQIVDDTNPYDGLENDELEKRIIEAKNQKKKKSMSFFTALFLSFTNLLTKKGRTFMTSFAGSIGIIGIALILSVSTGVNNYINAVQRDTLASYPIQIYSESVDLSSLITTLMDESSGDKEVDHDLDKVYESAIIAELMNSLTESMTNKKVNDLKSFKKFIDSNEELKEILTAVQYQYSFNWTTLTKNENGTVVKSSLSDLLTKIYGTEMASQSNSLLSTGSLMSSYDVWQEALSDDEGMINQTIKDEYEVLYGDWPTNYNQVILVLDKNNEISDITLYSIGLKSLEEIKATLAKVEKQELIDTNETKSWNYEDIVGKEFRVISPAEIFVKQSDNTFKNMLNEKNGEIYLYNSPNIGINLEICGIVRPSEKAAASSLSGSIIYTSALTNYTIEHNMNNTLLQQQLNDLTIDVFNGLPFKNEDASNDEIKSEVDAYIASLSTAQKAELYVTLMCIPDANTLSQMVYTATKDITIENARDTIKEYAKQAYPDFDDATIANYVNSMSDAEIEQTIKSYAEEQCKEQYKLTMQSSLSSLDEDTKAAQFDTLSVALTDEQYTYLYENELPFSENSLVDVLLALGFVDKENPAIINLYVDTFEKKDAVAEIIENYNNSVEDEKQISYTDYVALLMSSITTIINAISYVLIAFVAISLVVSSIMIGIITYISVLERTKEIGVLRAIGASKRDVGRVFNAETLIVGFAAGLIGILISLILILIINIILYSLTDISALKATLPFTAALALIGISMFLTFIAGLFPSSFAAKKNPVEALRTE